MKGEERVRRDWQRRFGLLADEQARQWRLPLVSLTETTVKAEVEAILWFKRTRALHRGALEGHAGYNALARLFSNGVCVAREIGTLIAHGYPYGALARWRTLHETTVVAQFIRTNPPAIGERYRDHVRIRRYRAMTLTKTLAARYGKPLPPGFADEYGKLRQERDALVGIYGPEFKSDHGWAAPAVGGSGYPRMRDLEEAVGMEHMRKAYADASESIHSGPGSLAWDLDPSAGRDMAHLFGPDADGSSLPGILVAHTFAALRVVWRAANESDNPFLAPDLLDTDVAKIHHEGNDLMRKFAACETSLGHLALATELLQTLTLRKRGDSPTWSSA